MRRAIAIAACCVFAAVPAAKAAYDPIGSGTTKLLLDKGFAAFLRKDGVKLSAAAPAKAKGKTLTLAVSGGSLDPTIGQGSIDQEGSLIFESQGRKVPLRQITLKTKHDPLIAKVGGGQLKLASSPKLSFRREGFGSSFGAMQLRLSAKLITRLNKKLRPKVPFGAGQLLGSLLSKTQPRLITITEANRATLLFDPAFVAKLDARFVSLNPIFPAEHQGPSFSFPIVIGGAIAPDGSEGTLRTGGQVELLQLGGAQLFWKELWLDLGARSETAEVDIEPTPAFPGKLGRIGVFGLGAASVSSDPATRTVSVAGAPLTLAAQTAASLNQAFAQGQAVFGAGEVVGSLSFSAVGE
jgi:hypothetical protein